MKPKASCGGVPHTGRHFDHVERRRWGGDELDERRHDRRTKAENEDAAQGGVGVEQPSGENGAVVRPEDHAVRVVIFAPRA